MIKQAIQHPGFGFVDILQPCVSFNNVNTNQWYRERVRELGPDYDPADRMAAFRTAFEWGERIPIGVIYRSARKAYAGSQPEKGKPKLVDRVTDKVVLQELFSQLR
jgi:2-oxoglutarate ferredoxin oxidoreductase subunit beta